MLREIIEDVKAFFVDYFEIYDKTARIPLSKILELSETLENTIVRIGEKSIYSCSEFAIISLKMILDNIAETAHESIDYETCIVDVSEMTEIIDNSLLITC